MFQSCFKSSDYFFKSQLKKKRLDSMLCTFFKVLGVFGQWHWASSCLQVELLPPQLRPERPPAVVWLGESFNDFFNNLMNSMSTPEVLCHSYTYHCDMVCYQMYLMWLYRCVWAICLSSLHIHCTIYVTALNYCWIVSRIHIIQYSCEEFLNFYTRIRIFKPNICKWDHLGYDKKQRYLTWSKKAYWKVPLFIFYYFIYPDWACHIRLNYIIIVLKKYYSSIIRISV